MVFFLDLVFKLSLFLFTFISPLFLVFKSFCKFLAAIILAANMFHLKISIIFLYRYIQQTTMYTTSYSMGSLVEAGCGDVGAAVGGCTTAGMGIGAPVGGPVGCSPDRLGIVQLIMGSLAGTIDALVRVPVVVNWMGGAVVGPGEADGGNAVAGVRVGLCDNCTSIGRGGDVVLGVSVCGRCVGGSLTETIGFSVGMPPIVDRMGGVVVGPGELDRGDVDLGVSVSTCDNCASVGGGGNVVAGVSVSGWPIMCSLAGMIGVSVRVPAVGDRISGLVVDPGDAGGGDVLAGVRVCSRDNCTSVGGGGNVVLGGSVGGGRIGGSLAVTISSSVGLTVVDDRMGGVVIGPCKAVGCDVIACVRVGSRDINIITSIGGGGKVVAGDSIGGGRIVGSLAGTIGFSVGVPPIGNRMGGAVIGPSKAGGGDVIAGVSVKLGRGDIDLGVSVGSCNNCTSIGGGGDVMGVRVSGRHVGGSIDGAVFCPAEVGSGNVIVGSQIGDWMGGVVLSPSEDSRGDVIVGVSVNSCNNCASVGRGDEVIVGVDGVSMGVNLSIVLSEFTKNIFEYEQHCGSDGGGGTMFAGVNGILPSGVEGYIGLREGNGSGVKGEGYIGLAGRERGVSLRTTQQSAMQFLLV